MQMPIRGALEGTQGKGHNRLFPTFELAREFKGEMASGKTTRSRSSS